jgi:ABC-type Fe3+ transport system substrate-binding protein
MVTIKKASWLAGGLVAALLLAACGSSDDDSPSGSAGSTTSASSDWQAGAGSDWQEVMTKAKQEGSVAVAGPANLGDPLAAAFKRDTGITMQYIGGSGGDLSSRFDTETRAGKPSIDILFGGGTQLVTLMPDNLLQPLKPQLILPSVKEGPNWSGGKWHWYDNAGTYLFQGTSYVFGYVTVNADEIDPSAIKSWNDLLDPKYKGKIIAYDPTANGPGQGATGAMAKVLGFDFIKKLYVDQQAKMVQDNEQLAQGVAQGDFPIALSLIQQEVQKYQDEGINLKAVLPSPMPGYLTAGFGVVREPVKAPHPNAAQVFLNWYASKAGQQVYQDTMLESSNRLDVDKKKIPSYTVPAQDADYFDDGLSEDYYVHQRKADIDKIVELLGGR